MLYDKFINNVGVKDCPFSRKLYEKYNSLQETVKDGVSESEI